VQLFEKIFTYLFPLSLLDTTPWRGIWEEKERADFLATARLFFPIAGLIYAGHYWFFDLPMGLEPRIHWLTFRSSMVAIALVTFVIYLSPIRNTRWYRAPAVVALAIFCYSQARVTVWYPEAPWIYCFVLNVITALSLRASVFKSAAYSTAVIALQWPSLMEANLTVPEAVSACAVVLLAIVTIRGSYAADIRYFLLNQQNIDAQKRNIELNIEFTDRIKSFIPAEIANRLEVYLRDRSTSVLEAIYGVLKPRRCEIACLFSDIRGFTEGSKNLDSFIRDSVVPNVKACTDALEEYGGIPRKIGDLLFAYFDHRSVHLNLIRAILSGLEVARINEEHNQGNSDIERYILIATGDAIVGNVGGFDSSVEITALGSPVNFLSRLDELTKNPKLRDYLHSSDLILCDRSMELLRELGVAPATFTVDLAALGLQIRSFPEVQRIHTMRPSKSNVELFYELYKTLTKRTSKAGDEDRAQAA
jgi:class 3 adenylate cyclase